MWSGPLTMTSVIDSSCRSGSSGPKPVTSLTISSTRRARSSRVTAKLCFVTTRSTIPSILVRTSVGGASTSESNALTTSVWRIRRISRISSSRAGVRDEGRAGSMTGTRALGGGGAAGAPWLAGAVAAAFAACCARSTRWSSDIGSVPSGPRRDSPSRSSGRTPERGSGPPMCRGLPESNSTIAEVRCGGATELMWSGRVGVGAGWRGPGTREQRRACRVYSPSGVGAIAQLGERLNGIQKVRGSNPLSSTNTLTPRRPTRPLAGTGGGFRSCQGREP